jgi:TPP-dependent pyruvate/acetoin dehydrogenase alpha subunit
LDTDLAQEVVQLRYWQHLLNEDLKRGCFNIPIHLAFGHEAIAVAVSRAMADGDQLALTHRNVAYNLVRAGELGPVYREYELDPSGLAGGRLGSMNLVNRSRGVAYASSILANNLAVACGMALAKRVRGREEAVFVLTGDGAMEEGQFYESLVFARSHDLSLVIVVENNDQSMASTIAERRVPIAIGNLCAAVDMPFVSLTGNDPFEYAATLAAARAGAVQERRPICIEAHLSALSQHAGPTPGWPTDPKRISLDDGLVIEETDADPVHVLRGLLAREVFDDLCHRVMDHAGVPLS